MSATTKRGRPSMIPTFLGAINTTPEGMPIVLQATAKTPALAYHHRRNLAKSGIAAEVIAPGRSRAVGNVTVTNNSEFYALVGVGRAVGVIATDVGAEVAVNSATSVVSV